MASKLRNYLRVFRKGMGLYQDEIAFLVGSEEGTTVSRYEHNERTPGLKIILAYEFILRVPARSLFAGLAQEVEEEIKHRARFLVQKLSKQKQDRLTERKLKMLKMLASGPGTKPGKDDEDYF